MKVYSVKLKILVAVDENGEVIWVQQNPGSELTRVYADDYNCTGLKFDPSDYQEHEVSLVEDF